MNLAAVIIHALTHAEAALFTLADDRASGRVNSPLTVDEIHDMGHALAVNRFTLEHANLAEIVERIPPLRLCIEWDMDNLRSHERAIAELLDALRCLNLLIDHTKVYDALRVLRGVRFSVNAVLCEVEGNLTDPGASPGVRISVAA